MIKIHDINDLTEYLRRRYERNVIYNYNDWLKTFPKSIQEIQLHEKYVKPENLTAEAFKSFFRDVALNIEPKFKEDNHCLPVINAICLYATKDPQFEKIAANFSLKKGLLINGFIGSGKTFLLNVLTKALDKIKTDEYNYNPSFQIIPTYEIVAQFGVSGFESLGSDKVGHTMKIENKVIALDDMGAENHGSHFGNTVNVISEIILRRYDNYKATGMCLTHGTTNLDQAHLKEFYGPRVFSRFHELFNVITLTGNDRRA